MGQKNTVEMAKQQTDVMKQMGTELGDMNQVADDYREQMQK